MNLKHPYKVAALVGMVALSFCLTGCYVPPDEISGTNNLTVGSQNLPFDTALWTATPTPSATPTGTPTNTPNINNLWGTTTNPVSTATNTPTLPGIIGLTTNIPTNTPAPQTNTPAPISLRLGSTGDEVRSLQKRLKELGYLSGSADGDFGTNTETAVKAFQARAGLTADGVVGARTKEKLYSNAAPTAPRATATPTHTPKPTATPNTSRYLEIGYSGSDVRQLQQRLITLGWLGGEADAYYGGATEAAVKAFQARSGLWNDGVAGPDTQNKLYSSSAAKSGSVVSSIGVSLKEGMESASVRAMQKRLKELSYLTGSVDGTFGAGTKAAVTAFQQQNGLKADGIAGTATLNKLYSTSAKKAASASTPTVKPTAKPNNNIPSYEDGSTHNTQNITSTGYITLREGDQSDAVTKLQKRLQALGYYKGYVDGKYGSGTVSAVKAYQQDHNLTADGVAGPATQRKLYGTSSTQTYSTLREGDSGSAVENMQYTLYELGYYDGKIDGKYGATTKDAVRAFQITNKLNPVDGIAGNKTLQKLYSSDPVKATQPSSDYDTLRPGDKGNDVVVLQDVLYQLGYLNASNINGKYDTATQNAVRNFQIRNGLSADGVAGPQTQEKLYSNGARNSGH